MKVRLVIILIVFFILLCFGYNNFFSTLLGIRPGQINTKDQQIVCINNHCFDSEIADSEEEREQGLMNRSILPTQSGMLFIFPQEGEFSFWMKNTLIPLDILWINSQHKIVDIYTAQPCITDPCPIYTPQSSGLYVLEINAGISSSLGIQVGSIVNIPEIQKVK